MLFRFPSSHDASPMLALRDDIVSSPVAAALHRARVFTRVWQATEGAPWVVRKAMALREYFRTVPLYLREHDRIAGSISETPGAMPIIVELGIGEVQGYIAEHPERQGYLRGKVPQEILDYWEHRNLWGRRLAYRQAVFGESAERGEVTGYGDLSNQGHLSPRLGEVLRVGLDGLLGRVQARAADEPDPEGLEFLRAAEISLLGLSEWIERYAEFLAGESASCGDAARSADLAEMSRIAAKVAHAPPETFREAMQLVWFIQQAVHIEGHGYSNTPDRLDQLLHPFYLADKQAGRLDDDQALTFCENFILKQRDNTFWGIEHNLTQGLVVGGSTPEGDDQTNELSWLFVRAADLMAVPEPLVWLRWNENIDPDFFDFCLETLAGRTCFPLMMSDSAVPEMLMNLGVSREDAYNYVPVGCNEIGIPGMLYYHPIAHVGYLGELEWAMTGGRGYDGKRTPPDWATPPERLQTFDDLTAEIGRYMVEGARESYAYGLHHFLMKRLYGHTPLTSCFFDGCIEWGRDLTAGTKYNILVVGGIAFANMVDCLAAVREVVYEKREATLAEVAEACAANFAGHEDLRRKLLAAPKHGNDDPRLADIVDLIERLRDRPVREFIRDPRDGTPAGNTHIVRSAAVHVGQRLGATPDGRLAGQPIASSVAASFGCERSGPTAVMNSILMMHPTRSWQCGYNVNLRFQPSVLKDASSREKVRAMLNSYFRRGGQEMQINSVDSDTLRAAQQDPDSYRDLVVRVAGFSETFVRLEPDAQEELIARTEHGS